ncbi:hypothetical protein SAMN05421825_2908 [Epilithonimonas hungarica]|uniref:Uncharacterized protein n=1 Tax=Epilithonimonas hungarica TaxID=454006 RepID=A0A1G7SBG5_9FLAO|nr:hypothetical protein SAMN05421825_2908 [Epilithonimonas hungarica]
MVLGWEQYNFIHLNARKISTEKRYYLLIAYRFVYHYAEDNLLYYKRLQVLTMLIGMITSLDSFSRIF